MAAANNPYYALRDHLGIYVSEEKIVFHLPGIVTNFLNHRKPSKDAIYFTRFKIKGNPVFNLKKSPLNFKIQIDGTNYSYPDDDIFSKPLPLGCDIIITAPNIFKIPPGSYRIGYSLARGQYGTTMKKLPVLPMSEMKISTSTTAKQEVVRSTFIDFETQRVCPKCGKILNIDNNFCKFCGADLGEIEAIGTSDIVSKNLAISAATDPSPEVRKEAVDTLGSFKDLKILGVLTYVLLNDPDEKVRKEAADELGDLHHPYSLDALGLALKDPSPIVRKEAISGLKKIKEKND